VSRARVRTQTLGRHHRLLANAYGNRVGGRDPLRERSALIHLCTHLDSVSRLLGDEDALHDQIGDRGFRDRQREVFGSSRQTLDDLRRNARRAVSQDRLDHLAEVVDWYGRTVQAAQAGLQAWAETHERGELERVIGIAQDCGRPDLARCLLAYEAWVRHEAGQGVSEQLIELLQSQPDTETGPYRVLAASIIQASGIAVPAWAQGLEAWSTLELGVHGVPEAGWPLRAWQYVAEGKGSVHEITDLLEGQDQTDWGRIVSSVLSALERENLGVEQVDRLTLLLTALLSREWWEVPLREVITALGPETRDRLTAVGFNLVDWWRQALAMIRSDYRGAASGIMRHILRLSLGTRLQGDVADLCLEFVEQFTETWFRRRVLEECPGIVGNELTERGHDRHWVRAKLARLVAIEASSVPEVTSDNLMFGIGYALGARGDRDSVHAAFDRIQNPWIKGQVLRVQPAERMAELELVELPAQLTNPLSQRFALAAIFEAIGGTCSGEDLDAGIRIAAMCEPYPEVRIAGLEGVLSGLGEREDQAQSMQGLWNHHKTLLDIPSSYRWRLVSLLLAAGVEPQDCPGGLEAWIRDSFEEFSPTEQGVLGAMASGTSWGLEPAPPEDVLAGARTTQLRLALTSSPPDLSFADPFVLEWSADEWVLWVNSLEIAAPGGLDSLAPEVAAFLAQRIGPANADSSSVFSILSLVAGAASTLAPSGDWSASHTALFHLASQPQSFTTELRELFEDDACWHSVLEWMSRGDPSRELVRWIHDPEVRDWLAGQQTFVTRSEYGRRYSIVKYPGRALLSWLTLMNLDAVRPAHILIAELLTRCAHPEELERLRESWLAESEEPA